MHTPETLEKSNFLIDLFINRKKVTDESKHSNPQFCCRH